MYVVEELSCLCLTAERDDVRIASARYPHTDVHPELWCSVASVHQIDLFPLLIFDSVNCPFAILRGQTYHVHSLGKHRRLRDPFVYLPKVAEPPYRPSLPTIIPHLINQFHPRPSSIHPYIPAPAKKFAIRDIRVDKQVSERVREKKGKCRAISSFSLSLNPSDYTVFRLDTRR